MHEKTSMAPDTPETPDNAQTKTRWLKHPKVYFGILAGFLFVPMLFAGLLAYSEFSGHWAQMRMNTQLRELMYVIGEVENNEGESGMRSLQLTDARVTAIQHHGVLLDELFVFSPVLADGTFLMGDEKNSPPRFIAWSKDVYRNQRILLWFGKGRMYWRSWEDDDRINWSTRTVTPEPTSTAE